MLLNFEGRFFFFVSIAIVTCNCVLVQLSCELDFIYVIDSTVWPRGTKYDPSLIWSSQQKNKSEQKWSLHHFYNSDAVVMSSFISAERLMLKSWAWTQDGGGQCCSNSHRCSIALYIFLPADLCWMGFIAPHFSLKDESKWHTHLYFPPWIFCLDVFML